MSTLRYHNNFEDLTSYNPSPAPPSLSKASNAFYDSPPVSPPASPSSIKPSGTVSPVQKAAKSAADDDITLCDLDEVDEGYPLDADVTYPAELEEYESEGEGEQKGSSADDSDADVTKRFESLQVEDGDPEMDQQLRQKHASKRPGSGVFKRTYDVTIEHEQGISDPDVLPDHDLASSARRLRRRVRETTDSKNPSNTTPSFEYFDGQSKIVPLDSDTWHDGGESVIKGDEYMSEYLEIPIPGNLYLPPSAVESDDGEKLAQAEENRTDTTLQAKNAPRRSGKKAKRRNKRELRMKPPNVQADSIATIDRSVSPLENVNDGDAEKLLAIEDSERQTTDRTSNETIKMSRRHSDLINAPTTSESSEPTTSKSRDLSASFNRPQLKPSELPGNEETSWEQFAANERMFGAQSKYDEKFYAISIDRSDPQYKQRAAEAERLAREIEGSTLADVQTSEQQRRTAKEQRTSLVADNLARPTARKEKDIVLDENDKAQEAGNHITSQNQGRTKFNFSRDERPEPSSTTYYESPTGARWTKRTETYVVPATPVDAKRRGSLYVDDLSRSRTVIREEFHSPSGQRQEAKETLDEGQHARGSRRKKTDEGKIYIGEKANETGSLAKSKTNLSPNSVKHAVREYPRGEDLQTEQVRATPESTDKTTKNVRFGDLVGLRKTIENARPKKDLVVELNQINTRGKGRKDTGEATKATDPLTTESLRSTDDFAEPVPREKLRYDTKDALISYQMSNWLSETERPPSILRVIEDNQTKTWAKGRKEKARATKVTRSRTIESLRSIDDLAKSVLRKEPSHNTKDALSSDHMSTWPSETKPPPGILLVQENLRHPLLQPTNGPQDPERISTIDEPVSDTGLQTTNLASDEQTPSDATVFEDIENFADLTILSDPADYWDQLDSIESRVIEICQIRSILPDPTSESSPAFGTPGIESESGSSAISRKSVRDRCVLSVDRVLLSIKMMHDDGLVKEDITVLVDDPRPNVVQTVTIPTADIQEFRDAIRYSSGSDVNVLKLATRLLNRFCPSELYLFSHDAPSMMNLLSSLLPLAVISCAGSHCSDFDQQIWECEVNRISVENLGPDREGYKSFGLRRQNFACLSDYIGGPVWVFGRGRRRRTCALLSITMEEFASIWGPLYAIPSKRGFQSLLALQTDGGIMYMSNSDRSLSSETSLHWVGTSLIRKDRSQLSSDALKMSCKRGEQLPADFVPFPSSGRFLIGQPTTGSTTVTSSCDADSTYRLSIHPKEQSGFSINAQCPFSLERFGQQNTFRLHAIGTRKEDYVPHEFQVGFNAGQYVNVGVQKVYRKRPAVDYKTVLLEYCSKPQASHARVRDILQLQVGLEMSACTKNARRTTLRHALTTAYPNELSEVSDACDSGDPLRVSAFLGDLQVTGVNGEDQLTLFWPLSCGIGEVIEWDDQSEWITLLKDSPSSACFAVLSDNCMSYTGHDARNTIRRECHPPGKPSRSPVLQTMIELHPQGRLKPPLKLNQKVNLSTGELHIRNEDTADQLAYYESCGGFRKWRRRGEVVHRELQNTSRASPYLVQVCIIDRPRDSI